MKKMTLSSGLLRTTLTLCLLTFGLFRQAGASTNPPERMTYQGFLVDANGAALGLNAPINYDLIFSIWDEQSGGESKWAEQQTVTIDKGYFSVLLGEGTPAGMTNSLSSAFVGDASSRFIEITVKGIGTDGADMTIRPRLQLVSSPYAFKAGGSVPVGGIIMWSGAIAEIPDGWALCNGANETPNLQDRFIVGAGGGYSVNDKGGSASVTLSVAQMPSHNHGGNTGSTSITQPGAFAAGAGWGVAHLSQERYGASHSHTIAAQGGNQSHENRPPYFALAFIMRVR